MRVLHINCNYIYTTLHQNMVLELKKLGIINHVFAPVSYSSKGIITPIEEAHIVECFGRKDRIVFDYKQKKILAALKKDISNMQFDLIHAYTLFTDGNAAMQLSNQIGIPYVVAVRNTDVNDFFKKMIYLRSRGVKILMNASAVFFLSKTYLETVLSKYVPLELRDGIRNKSYVIPNGIDNFWHMNKYKRDVLTEGEFMRAQKQLKCIFVGGIDSNKNVELTLKALSDLNNQKWKCSLTAVGRIVENRTFGKLCKYDCFNYMGSMQKEELISFYRNANIFVMPSHKETFGLVYPEAMSQGLPVIYTKGQGFDGQFEEGVVGYSVNDKDVNSLKKMLVMIVENYEEISKNTLSAIDKFRWDQICQEYTKVYNIILN